jgi:hypothetical protein
LQGIALALRKCRKNRNPEWLPYKKSFRKQEFLEGTEGGDRKVVNEFFLKIFSAFSASFAVKDFDNTGLRKGGTEMMQLHDERFMFLEIKAAQIRKLLLGSLLLAKNTWKDELLRTPQGLDVIKTIEEAEEDFIDPSITDPVEKLDDVLGVINKRARAVVVLLDYIAEHK